MTDKGDPFASDYNKDANVTSARRSDVGPKHPSVPAQDEFAGDYTAGSRETPALGKPYGTGKPRRVIIRGKIARE